MTHRTRRAKKRVDAKIPPDGFSRSTYARDGEICFTLSTEPKLGPCMLEVHSEAGRPAA
jgi:hypothetical protein